MRVTQCPSPVSAALTIRGKIYKADQVRYVTSIIIAKNQEGSIKVGYCFAITQFWCWYRYMKTYQGVPIDDFPQILLLFVFYSVSKVLLKFLQNSF